MAYKDPEKKKIWQAAWYVAHRKEENARSIVWRRDHRDEVKTYNRAWRADHPEEAKATSAAWRKNHPQEAKTTGAARRKARPEFHRTTEARRRARRKGLPNTLTVEQWEAIKQVYRYRCAYCGAKEAKKHPLTQDHVVPIKKGGGTTMDNIVPACRSCNSKKGTNLPANPVKLILI